MKILKGSKKKLLYLTKKKGSISVDEAVEATGLAKATLRQHFSELEEGGFLVKSYERSGRGRPSSKYKITGKGNELFPSSEAQLLRNLLKFLKNNEGEELLTAFFEKYWENRLESVRQKMGDVSEIVRKKDFRALIRMLEKEGFMPEFSLNEEQNTFQVQECNCPFSEVVKETRLPCKLEAQFFAKLFNGEVERTAYLPDGDHSCTYKINLD